MGVVSGAEKQLSVLRGGMASVVHGRHIGRHQK